jgi:hypothetical protein
MRMTVGVVGTGNMGSALVRGWLRSPDSQVDLLVYDIVEERARDFADTQNVAVAASLDDLAERSDVIMVVVKPKDAQAVLRALRLVVAQGKTIVSSAAGITLDSMRAALGPGPALFRIMPNLGVELGEGVVALSPEPGTSEDATGSLVRLFACMGMVEALPEDMLVHRLFGSGAGRTGRRGGEGGYAPSHSPRVYTPDRPCHRPSAPTAPGFSGRPEGPGGVPRGYHHRRPGRTGGPRRTGSIHAGHRRGDRAQPSSARRQPVSRG